MGALVLQRLLANGKALVGVAVLAAFLSVAGLAHIRGQKIAALEAQNIALAGQVKTVGALLETQNQAVLDLKRASDAQARRAADAAKTAQNALQAANARAAALALTPVPSACPDALEWLRAQVAADESTRGAK